MALVFVSFLVVALLCIDGGEPCPWSAENYVIVVVFLMFCLAGNVYVRNFVFVLSLLV